MSNITYRVGLIGAGIIAEARVPALRAAGLEVAAVAARPGSPNVAPFAAKLGVAQTFDDWRELLAAPFDALVISTWPDGTPEVLEAALELGVPTLVEKPVAWNSAAHRRLLARPHSQVIVGYNRRFYPMVQAARAEAQGGPPLIAQLTLPTNVVLLDRPDPTGASLQEFFESVSALGLDLTRFVLGDLRVDHVSRLRDGVGNLVGLAALLSTARGDILQLACPWGSAANYSLSLSRHGRRFELLPFEVGSSYAGMEVHPPSDEYPIRRYLPKLQGRINLDGEDLRHKPGFFGEARVLRAMVEGQAPPPFVARLEDAAAVTRLCEELTGVTLGDVNPSTYHH